MVIDWVQLIISFVLGVCAGQLLRFERIPRGKRAILRPHLVWPSLDNKWITLILVALFLLSGVQVTWWTIHQRECNEVFQSTTVQLRSIATEDRDLENQDDALQDQRDDAFTAMITAMLVTPPPSEPRVDARALLERYREIIRGIDLQRADLHARRVDLERQRKTHVLPARPC